MHRALLVTLALMLAACGSSDRAHHSSGALHRGLSGEPATLDPAMATDTFSLEVIRDLYQGLTDESPAGEIIPGVAQSWTVDADGTTYTFHLRPDAHWSDGKPVTAADFVAAWRRALDPTLGAPNAEILRIIDGASAIIAGKAAPETLQALAVTAQDLTVHLSQPAPHFPSILAHPGSFPVYSDAAARSHAASTWVSNGPYVLTGWSHGGRLTLTRNSKYWDTEHVSIEEVNYEIAPDEFQQFRAYRAGQLDMTDNASASDFPAIRRAMPQDLRLGPILATVYLSLNLTQGPLAAHPELRQALALAIDRPRVTELLAGGQISAFGFLPPGTSNYTPQVWDWNGLPSGERIARAQALYAKAGFSKRTPLKLRLICNSNPGIKQTVVAIAAMWSETLGVETQIAEEEYRVFLDTRHDYSRWDVARLAWSADYNDAASFLDTLRSGSVNNDEGYASPDFDSRLDAAAHTASAEERRGLLQGAENAMLADYPIIPVYFLVAKRLVRPYVSGMQMNPLNHVATRNLVLAAH